MFRNILSTIILILCVLPIKSQNREFTVSVSPVNDDTEVLMYMYPLIPFASYNAIPMTKVSTGEYKVDIPYSENGFYRIVMVRGGMQLITSIYMPGKEPVKVEADIKDNSILVNNSSNNMALTSYAAFTAQNARSLWNTEPTDDAMLMSALKHYISAADSIMNVHECTPNVKEFIKLWSYTTAYNGMHSVSRIARQANHELSFKSSDVLGNINKELDCNMSTIFSETFSIIGAELKNDTTLIDKFESLYSRYKNDSVRACVGNVLLSRFLSRHNYETDFNGGLEQLKFVVEKYNLNDKYIKDYNKRKAMIKGTLFPENVVLRTAEGDTVDFSSFKGKYVYIDMWASWCTPCRKEIPHLQKLENELQNEDVVFVSISIDSNENAWKDKLAHHNMHGNQFIEKEGRLAQALNVAGIPFFVIYDKEGRLYMHGAPRPSSGQTLKDILEQLH